MTTVGWDAWNSNLLAAYVQVPRAMASLSLIGSSWIAYEVLSDAKKRKHIQQRLLLGMALTDIISSITYIWGVAAFPVEMETEMKLVQGAYGNTATCDVQGFLGQFVPSTAFYNGFLALYYLGMIKYRWNHAALKKMENIAHVVAIVFPVVSGALGIYLEVFNPAYIHCWIYEYPYGCLHSDTECIRGGSKFLVVGMGWLFYYFPAIISLLFGSYAMRQVSVTVKETLNKSSKYKFAKNTTENDGSNVAVVVERQSFPDDSHHAAAAGAPIATNMRRKQNEKTCQLSKNVATQGLWYFGAFAVTWFFPFLTTILENFGIDNIPVLFCLAITLPLQGFLNWVVYMRPRAIAYYMDRKESNNASTLLTEQAVQSKNSSNFLTNTNKQKSTENIDSVAPPNNISS